jgi:hypothetical protein
MADATPRPRAADDFDTIRARLEEIRRGRRNPTGAVFYCRACGAAEVTEADARCNGACQRG